MALLAKLPRPGANSLKKFTRKMQVKSNKQNYLIAVYFFTGEYTS